MRNPWTLHMQYYEEEDVGGGSGGCVLEEW